MSTTTAPELVVVIGAGSIAQAITRRIGVAKTLLLADVNKDAAAAAADTLESAGFTTHTARVDVADQASVRARRLRCRRSRASRRPCRSAPLITVSRTCASPGSILAGSKDMRK